MFSTILKVLQVFQVFQVSLVSLTQVKHVVCHLLHMDDSSSLEWCCVPNCLFQIWLNFSNCVKKQLHQQFSFLNESLWTNCQNWDMVVKYLCTNSFYHWTLPEFVPGDPSGFRCVMVHINYTGTQSTWSTWNTQNTWNNCNNYTKLIK